MPRILGLGTDIIEISRIREVIGRRKEVFLNKIYTPRERAYCDRFKDPAPYYAARFAAKEAVAKALGIGMRLPLSWLRIEISHSEKGKPVVTLDDEVLSHISIADIMLTMSHCHEYAVATALCLA